MRTRICDNCSKPFSFPTSQRSRKFCSLSCSAKHQKREGNLGFSKGKKVKGNIWDIYWKYELKKERPRKSSDDYALFKYAEFLRRTERFVPFRAKL